MMDVHLKLINSDRNIFKDQRLSNICSRIFFLQLDFQESNISFCVLLRNQTPSYTVQIKKEKEFSTN